jgi:hypothetical protein
MLVLHGGIPIQLPKSWRRSVAYRRYRAGLARATTFQAAVEYLNGALEDPHLRLFAAADFAPHATYAQQFLNSAALYRRGSEDEQFMAIKAQQVLTRLLIATAGGHPREPVSADIRLSHTAERVAYWTEALEGYWPHPEPVLLQLGRVASWTVAHRKALRVLLTRKSKRPVHVAHQLTAWEFGVSVRAIRKASRPHPHVILKSA